MPITYIDFLTSSVIEHIAIIQIIEMEKEIYITETPYYSEINETSAPAKEKITPSGFQSRIEGKANGKKIIERFPQQNYYDDKKIKPGISLYKTIIDLQQRRSTGQFKGPHLRMSIPQTVLLIDNSNSMIYVDGGVVKVQSFSSNESFLHRLDVTKLGIYPCVIHSSISGINFSNSIMMNNEIVGNKIIPRSQGFICRKFMIPYNHTPNILRLYFTPRKERQLKKNYAFKMVNYRQMDEQMFKKKHRLINNYIVNSQRQDSYSLTMMKGKCLVQCEEMTESLIQYLQKGVLIKISQIVIDFVVDQNKHPWFHQIKSIKSTLMTKLWDVGTTEEIQLITQKNNNCQMCKLCGIMYSKHQIEKIVTNKLIWQLISHLENRGVLFKALPHLKKQGLSYVCDICYEVIVAEHKLINVQKQFSNLLNISPNTIERVTIKTNKNPPPIVLTEQDFKTAGAEVPKLKAWRLFFYLQKIKNYQRKDGKRSISINLEMKFKNFKEHFVKFVANENQQKSKIFKSRYSSVNRVQSAKLQKHSILLDRFNQSVVCGKLQKSKVIQTVTTMASKIQSSIVGAELVRQTLSIQKVKVYVVYTKSNQFSSLFTNTEMQFTLMINDQKFTGRSATLQQLKNKDTCQRHSSEIFLFDSHLKYCNLQLTVGLISDGEVLNEDIQLSEVDGIYYPAKPTSICKPLPDQWMEVFTKGEEVPTHAKELSYQEIKQSHLRKQSKIRQELQIIDL